MDKNGHNFKTLRSEEGLKLVALDKGKIHPSIEGKRLSHPTKVHCRKGKKLLLKYGLNKVS